MTDIVERLRKIEALKPGDMVPPELYDNSGSWAVLMSKLCGDGADEIECLRAQVSKLSMCVPDDVYRAVLGEDRKYG